LKHESISNDRSENNEQAVSATPVSRPPPLEADLVDLVDLDAA